MQTKIESFQVTLTPQEATELLKLLDAAVRARGLEVAHNVAFLSGRIQGAHDAAMKAAMPENVVQIPPDKQP